MMYIGENSANNKITGYAKSIPETKGVYCFEKKSYCDRYGIDLRNVIFGM